MYLAVIMKFSTASQCMAISDSIPGCKLKKHILDSLWIYICCRRFHRQHLSIYNLLKIIIESFYCTLHSHFKYVVFVKDIILFMSLLFIQVSFATNCRTSHRNSLLLHQDVHQFPSLVLRNHRKVKVSKCSLKPNTLMNLYTMIQ